MKRQFISALALAGTAVAVSLGTGTAATASPAAADHCAVHLDSGRMVCAATQEQADRQLGVRSWYLVVQVWKGASYTGNTIRYWKSGKCTSTMSDKEVSVPVLPSGWNDTLTSVKTDLTAVTNCSLRIYRDGRHTGSSFTIDRYTPNLAGHGWNNIASSWYVS